MPGNNASVPDVLLITGASSGIGLALARRAAQAGARLALLARGPEALKRADEECRSLGAGEVLTVSADVGEADAVDAAVARITAELGPPDAVVHSAGVVAYGRFEEIPREVFDQVLRTNTLGSANVVRAVLPQMRERDRGHLVLLGSLIGHLAPPYMSPYSVSKWAVRELARTLLIENRDRPGVHISYLSPGGVDTPIYRLGANYMGHVGRPPAPVASPEKVADKIWQLFADPKPSTQVGLTNGIFSLGFSLFPRLYDAIVTPTFTVMATDQRVPRSPTTGNVFDSAQDEYQMHGHQGSAAVSAAAALIAKLRRG